MVGVHNHPGAKSSQRYARVHTHTRKNAHMPTHAHTHTHTRTQTHHPADTDEETGRRALAHAYTQSLPHKSVPNPA